MDNREYLIGIDIGSSNVSMAVGVRNENGELSILGVDVQKVEDCVKDGDIDNFILLGDAISKAKKALESELHLQLNSAYVGISGRSVYCVRYEDYVDINERSGCVTDFEMRELNARIDMVVPGGGDEIVDRILLRYNVDDRQGVQNPLGAFGKRLSATYLFVMAGRVQIDRVKRALHRADIRPNGLCVNPTLLPELLLSADEKEEGVAIVDIGGDLTDIAVVREGKLCHFSSLPIGSSSINNDLREFLKIPKKDIDSLKHKFGAAVASGVPENVTIPVKTAGHAKKQILQRNIAEIAEARLKDIAQFVVRELKGSKFISKIPCGVVLTGGAVYLANIDQLFAREMNMEVRFGDMLNGLDEVSQQSICAYPQAAVMGLLLYGAKHSACEAMPGVNGRVAVNPPVEDNITTPEVNMFGDNSQEKPIEDATKNIIENVGNGGNSTNGSGDTVVVEHTGEGNDEVKDNYGEDEGGENPDDGENGNSGEGGNNNGEDGANGSTRSKGILGRIRDWIDKSFEQDQII